MTETVVPVGLNPPLLASVLMRAHAWPGAPIEQTGPQSEGVTTHGVKPQEPPRHVVASGVQKVYSEFVEEWAAYEGTAQETSRRPSAADPIMGLLPNPESVTVLGKQLSRDTLGFCVRHRILSHLGVAIRLVEEYFPRASDFSIGLEQDPDSDEEWITITFTLGGEPEDILDRYDAYVDTWVARVPWPERDMIRLCYYVV